MSTYEPPFTAWLTLDCPEQGCGEHRVDLLLVRGLDRAGGPQVWHAMAPADYAGHPVESGTVRCETAGELDDGVLIEWPLIPCASDHVPVVHAHLIGAQPLQHTLS